MNRTQAMEANIDKFKQTRYIVARRIIDCKDTLTDIHLCCDCQDRPLCRQIVNVLFAWG